MVIPSPDAAKALPPASPGKGTAKNKLSLPFTGVSTQRLKEVVGRLLQKNRYDKALQEVIKAAEKNPQDMRLKLKMGELHFKRKDIANAIRVYSEVADHYAREKFYLKAVAIYKNVLKISPTSVAVNLKLAELYRQVGMVQDAVNQYRIAIQYYSSHKMGELTVEICRHLVSLDPSPEHRRKLGETLQAQGQTAPAVQEFEELARVYRERKDYDNLLQVYELILHHKQDNRAILRDVCVLYLRKRQPEYALKKMDRYKLEDDPDFKDLYDKAVQLQELLKGQKKGKGKGVAA